MELDVVLLSRLQFALTVMFHYLFPPLTIGLGALMVGQEFMYLKTGNKAWERACRYWTKIFALNFALGVATGIVMEFQFGTNWATYSRFVGDVFGSALAAEAIFAFFLESGFLAVLVFGWDRVGPKMHFFSTLMVFLGSAFSAIWIVVANSWQQTPAGHKIVEHTVGEQTFLRAEIVDFWAMVFNPSSVVRLTHVYIGAFILGAFFVMSISAWYILKNRHLPFATRSFKIALVMGLIFSWAALIQGHIQAKNVYETQPAKLAAFEGHYTTVDGGADLWLFGIPDDEAEVMRYGLRIPGGLSFLVHEDFGEPVTALDVFPPEERPPVLIPFLTYRTMVGIGFTLIALSTLATFFWWRGTLFDHRWLMWVFVGAVILPYIANQAGWVACETGRQPWVVYPVVTDDGTVVHEGLKTKDAVSRAVKGEQVLWSIIMFGLIYTMLFGIWAYVLNSKIQHGPTDEELHEEIAHAREDRGKGFLATASERVDEHGRLTGAAEEEPTKEDTRGL